jgi:diguanylate cyclase (GGDEF)-like protein
LQDCARAWHAQIRTEDLLARYGGDEFALILPACGLEDALVVVERMHAATPGNTSSAGIAEWEPTESEVELLGRADERLYAAKRRGGGRVVGEAVRFDEQPALTVAGPVSPATQVGT